MYAFKILAFLLLTSFVIFGCSGTSNTTDDDNRITFSSNLYGQWTYIDSGETLDVVSTTKVFGYEEKSEDLILVLDDVGASRYLVRSSIRNTVLNGTITEDTAASRAPSRGGLAGIGGITVLLNNVNDQSIKAEVQTQSDGSFSDDTLPSGDYTITVDDGTNVLETKISLEGNANDLGDFQLLESGNHNFKTELILDENFIFSDTKVYTATIRVHNIGDQDSETLFYDINISDYYLETFHKTNIIDPIAKNAFSDIPITFSFKDIPTSKRKVEVRTSVKDVSGNVWEDTIYFDLYKRSMDIKIEAKDAALQGSVIAQGYLAIPFNEYNNTVVVPVDATTKYEVVLTCQTSSCRSVYSIGVNTQAQDLEQFNNPIAYEPNDNQSSAATLSLGKTAIAYIDEDDIDYYTLNMAQDNNVSFAGIFDDVDEAYKDQAYVSTVEMKRLISVQESAYVSVTNGLLYKNGNEVADTGTTFDYEDNLSVKLQSSSLYDTRVSSTITVNNYNFVYAVTTRPASAGENFITKRGVDYGVEVFSDEISMSKYLSGAETTMLTMLNNTGTIYVNNSSKGTSVEVNASDRVKVSLWSSAKYNVETNVTLQFDTQNLSFTAETKGFSRDAQGIVSAYNALMWEDTMVHPVSSYSDAETYCNALLLGGYNDWRMPTIGELKSIGDSDNSNPSIVSDFVYTRNSRYISSSETQNKIPNTSRYEHYGFDYRDLSESNDLDPGVSSYAYRCVRSAP